MKVKGLQCLHPSAFNWLHGVNPEQRYTNKAKLEQTLLLRHVTTGVWVKWTYPTTIRIPRANYKRSLAAFSWHIVCDMRIAVCSFQINAPTKCSFTQYVLLNNPIWSRDFELYVLLWYSGRHGHFERISAATIIYLENFSFLKLSLVMWHAECFFSSSDFTLRMQILGVCC